MTCWLCGFETTELATNARPSACKNGRPCQICMAIDEVDKEIDQAVANLRRLIETRRHLRSERNRAHDLVHRLPVELKNHIFELLRPWNEWGEIPRSEKPVMPSYLASICKGWRDIAWSNPFLWASMHITIGPHTTADSSKHMRDWILRSDTLPLTFHIQVADHTEGGFEPSRDMMVPILDAVSQCSYRLQSLSLDVPHSILYAYPSSNIQWDRLTRLRIISSFPKYYNPNQVLSLFNPTANPEMVDLHHLSLRSVQISWNRLSSAIIRNVSLEDLTHLFQQASQMTHCQIFNLQVGPGNLSVPPITHHRLKTLALWRTPPSQLAFIFLGSLTLPCLQEFSTSSMVLLIHLPALVHRSSCPLTSLTLSNDLYADMLVLPDVFPPLLGVTKFVVGTPQDGHHASLIKKLLLEDYLPDLRHLIFRLETFLSLWDTGIVPLYLDRKRPQSDGFNEGRLETFRVRAKGDELDRIWNSDVGQELKALNASLREDGFEFL